MAVITLDELVHRYTTWLSREVEAGRARPRTLDYYQRQLEKFCSHAGRERSLESLVPFDLERTKRGWHSVQAVQRLFNWGVKMGLVVRNPFTAIERPVPGQRERTLTSREMVRLLRGAGTPLRYLLVGLRETLARPQEIRELRWRDLESLGRAFVMPNFKSKRRRKDRLRFRVIPVTPRLSRLLVRLQRRTPTPEPNDPVFVNTRGQAWTTNALRLAMRRLRQRVGLVGREPVVAYTLRHTAATRATANGVFDRTLAELMGHASTQTTARYQHLQLDHLSQAIRRATKRRA